MTSNKKIPTDQFVSDVMKLNLVGPDDYELGRYKDGT